MSEFHQFHPVTQRHRGANRSLDDLGIADASVENNFNRIHDGIGSQEAVRPQRDRALSVESPSELQCTSYECRQRRAGRPVELVNGAGGPAKGGCGRCDLSTRLLEWIVDALNRLLQSSMLQRTAKNCKGADLAGKKKNGKNFVDVRDCSVSSQSVGLR